MKQILAILLLAASASAMAQHHGYHHHGYWRPHNSGWVWVAPTIIGGVIGYEIARNQPPVVVQQPAPVVIQQPAPYYGQSQNCSPWTEVQNPDGTVTRTRTCAQ
jgi:hypothetical protein